MEIYAPYYDADGPKEFLGGFYRTYEEALLSFQKSFGKESKGLYFAEHKGIAVINLDAPVDVQVSYHELPNVYGAD